jgi:hypothetical protein
MGSDSLELAATILADYTRLASATRFMASAEELPHKQEGMQLAHEALEQTRDEAHTRSVGTVSLPS